MWACGPKEQGTSLANWLRATDKPPRKWLQGAFGTEARAMMIGGDEGGRKGKPHTLLRKATM